jgi:DeoR family transcriptional regulator of aga operon/DeoR family fructose operon transcriptional repressor
MQHERRSNIVSKIRKLRVLKVNDLMREYQVSIETIRRDLEFLEQQGQLHRVYGGAILNSFYGVEEQYENREQINFPHKQAIGKRAASFISDGDTLFVDSGTTVMEFVRNLGNKKNLTVITCSLFAAQALASDSQDCRVILLGGELRRDELVVSGSLSTANLQNFFASKTVIGMGGITPERGITDFNFQEAGIRRLMIERANMVIGLADYSKFGVTVMNHICPVEKLNMLFTDWTTPDAVLDTYRSRGIEVYTAPNPETGGV